MIVNKLIVARCSYLESLSRTWHFHNSLSKPKQFFSDLIRCANFRFLPADSSQIFHFLACVGVLTRDLAKFVRTGGALRRTEVFDLLLIELLLLFKVAQHVVYLLLLLLVAMLGRWWRAWWYELTIWWSTSAFFDLPLDRLIVDVESCSVVRINESAWFLGIFYRLGANMLSNGSLRGRIGLGHHYVAAWASMRGTTIRDQLNDLLTRSLFLTWVVQSGWITFLSVWVRIILHNGVLGDGMDLITSSTVALPSKVVHVRRVVNSCVLCTNPLRVWSALEVLNVCRSVLRCLRVCPACCYQRLDQI